MPKVLMEEMIDAGGNYEYIEYHIAVWEDGLPTVVVLTVSDAGPVLRYAGLLSHGYDDFEDTIVEDPEKYLQIPKMKEICEELQKRQEEYDRDGRYTEKYSLKGKTLPVMVSAYTAFDQLTYILRRGELSIYGTAVGYDARRKKVKTISGTENVVLQPELLLKQIQLMNKLEIPVIPENVMLVMYLYYTNG